MAIIQVTNNGDEPLTDRYDGKVYDFIPGENVVISEEVARHIFGYGEDDKLPTLQRLGWVRHSSEIERGLERLNQFSFSTGKLVFEGSQNRTPKKSAKTEDEGEQSPKTEEEDTLARLFAPEGADATPEASASGNRGRLRKA